MPRENRVIIPWVLIAVLLAGGSSGCATVVKGGSAWGQVQFRNTPKFPDESLNLKVWVDGKPMEPKFQFSKIVGNTVVSEPTIDLSTKKKASYAIRIQSGGCEAEFTVSRSVSGWWIVGNLFLTGGVGIVVDWATGAWYEFGSSAVNYVPSLMKSRGRPVEGVVPVVPCGGAGPAASGRPVPNS